MPPSPPQLSPISPLSLLLWILACLENHYSSKTRSSVLQLWSALYTIKKRPNRICGEVLSEGQSPRWSTCSRWYHPWWQGELVTYSIWFTLVELEVLLNVESKIVDQLQSLPEPVPTTMAAIQSFLPLSISADAQQIGEASVVSMKQSGDSKY